MRTHLEGEPVRGTRWDLQLCPGEPARCWQDCPKAAASSLHLLQALRGHQDHLQFPREGPELVGMREEGRTTQGQRTQWGMESPRKMGNSLLSASAAA